MIILSGNISPFGYQEPTSLTAKKKQNKRNKIKTTLRNAKNDTCHASNFTSYLVCTSDWETAFQFARVSIFVWTSAKNRVFCNAFLQALSEVVAHSLLVSSDGLSRLRTRPNEGLSTPQ